MTMLISDLFDHPVDPSRVDELVCGCNKDPSLKQIWQRYHIVRSILKHECAAADLKYDVADEVMSRIKAEQRPQGARIFTLTNAKLVVARPWLSLAVAAGLLLAVFMLIKQPARQSPVGDYFAGENMGMNHWQAANDDIEQTLNTLLVEHSEFTSVTGINGFGSYSKFVSYQN